jgi:tetratricopeptide (TPR) repeat protein
MKKDPTSNGRVSSLLPRVWSHTLSAILIAAAIAACGGKGKNDKTTPGSGSGSGSGDPSMKDPGDPTGGNTGGTGNTGGNTGGPTAGSGGPTNSGGPSEVPFTPPNYDPDPAQVKTQVDQQIAAAKAALAQPTPDADGALRSARAALALDASSVEAASYVAFAYYHKKLYDTAELVLDDMMNDKGLRGDTAKKSANVSYVYGLIYDKTNRPERAEFAFKTAVQLDPNHVSAHVNNGVYQLKNSKYAEAQATFEKLTKQFNRVDAITLTSLGSAYRGRSADYPKGAPDRDQFVRSAEASYNRALQTSSNYGPAYYNLGLLYLDTDPYPGIADPVARLTKAKGYFDQYKNMPGVDIKLYDKATKDVDKLIKRAQKAQKKPKTT